MAASYSAQFAGAMGDGASCQVNVFVRGDLAALLALNTLAREIRALSDRLDMLAGQVRAIRDVDGIGSQAGDVGLLPVAGGLVPGRWLDEPASYVIADQVEADFGLPLVGVLAEHAEMASVGLHDGRLRIGGPVLHRTVRLVEQAAPHRPAAVCWSLLAPDRLPEPVRAELAGGEPLDRLLTRHGVQWRGELIAEEVFTAPSAEASCDLSWLEPGGSFVHLARLVSVDGEPVATLIDEAPIRSEWDNAPVHTPNGDLSAGAPCAAVDAS